MAKSARTIFQLGALVMLLIVFPAASWYYLNSGLQYRRSAMAELGDFGSFPKVDWMMVDGTSLPAGVLDKKMILAQVLPPSTEESLTTQYGQTLKQLHDQFDERDELAFLIFLREDNGTSLEQLRQFAQTYELEDEDQLFFIKFNKQEWAQMENGLFQSRPEDIDPTSFLLLTDVTAKVRRYYDVREELDIKRLVEHIALLLPFKNDRELIFKREVEK